VDMIADELVRGGKVADPLKHRPFRNRLAELFCGLTDQDFLRYGRSWRDRIPGYFNLSIQRPPAAHVHAEQFRPCPVECRPAVSADGSRPNGTTRNWFPCSQPAVSGKSGDIGRLAR